MAGDAASRRMGKGVSILCRVLGHSDEYTDEYEKPDGHVRADRVCTRCGRRKLAWTGPKADALRELGFDVPEEPPEI